MIEWNRGDGVVEYVRLNNVVEEIMTDETKITINRRCCSTHKTPSLRCIVRQRWVGVMKVGDCNFQT